MNECTISGTISHVIYQNEENGYTVLRLVTDDGEKGILKDVIETGANEVYVVQFETSGEVLIPAIRDCILDVDVEAGSMRVHLLEGLKE